jgi:hypothetical protein
MNLSATKSRLAALTKELWVRWGETKNFWRDAKSAEFQHRYMEELMIRVDKAVTVLEKLDALLGKVKKDCE